MNSKLKLVTQEEQAIDEIRSFQSEGYSLEEIYVIAHDTDKTDGLAKLMSTNKVGLYEEGIANAFTNLFRSRGDQLRVKMQSLGLTKDAADYYEKELDKGKILIMVWTDDIDFDDMDEQKKDLRKDDLRKDKETIMPPTGVYTTERSGSGDVW
jgi:DNA-binding transcriptional MerR regulator